VWLVVALVVCFFAGIQTRPDAPGPADPAADAVGTVLEPVQGFLGWIGHGVGGAWRFIGHVGQLERDNQALRQEAQAARTQRQQAEEWRQEAARLQALLGLRSQVDTPSVAARVIGRSPSPWFQTLTLGAGRRDGVMPGALALGPGGVLGQVYQVGLTTSQVLCLTDRLGRVGARLQPERARQVVGVCRGDGGTLCHMTYPDSGAQVKPGDTVVTSGYSHGSWFPPGLVVGQVVKVERRPQEASMALTIRPAVAADRAEEVLVLLPPVEPQAADEPPAAGQQPTAGEQQS
jgi:rod shape-determining protein MreC